MWKKLPRRHFQKYILPPSPLVLMYNYNCNYILVLFGCVGNCLVCRVLQRNLTTPDRLLLQLLVLGKKEKESVIVDPNFLSCLIFFRKTEEIAFPLSTRQEFPAFDYYYYLLLLKEMLFSPLPINTWFCIISALLKKQNKTKQLILAKGVDCESAYLSIWTSADEEMTNWKNWHWKIKKQGQ